MIRILNQQCSVLNEYVAELRNVEIQNDPLRFRTNLERIGSIIGYELSKELAYEDKEVTTPLGISVDKTLKQQPVLATILRAGLGMHNGLLQVFDRAENAFVSAFRKHTHRNEFEIVIEYLASPSIEGKTVIISDPMLATGNSMVLCYEAMLQKGTPKHLHVVAAIGSQQGVDFVKQKLPKNTTIWVGAVDAELNDKAYIVPGLGDAGDLAFGTKE